MSKTWVAIISLCIGLSVGFGLGIASTEAGRAFVSDLASSEQPADTTHPTTLTRAGYSLKYPGNWKIDTADSDYDPDHLLSIDSPGTCFVMLVLIDAATDPAWNVQTQVDAHVPKLMKTPTRAPFTKWGKYQGQGVYLKGKVLGITPGGVRIFSYSQETRSFVVVEFCHDEDMKNVKPGFELLESSFDLAP